MLIARWTPPRDLELWGTMEQLSDLAARLRGLSLGEQLEMTMHTEARQEPNGKLLDTLIVRACPQMVRVTVEGDCLRIDGHTKGITALAGVCELVSSSGSHYHFEGHDGHPLISEDSIPLVVGVLDQ